jgi:hypothetical protein
MASLLNKAAESMSTEYPGIVLYGMSIWTDANAATSAISVDTEENSRARVTSQREWNAKQIERLVAAGDQESAKLFELGAHARNCNPADFALSRLVVVNHRSFNQGWESATQGKCWKELAPALKLVQRRALEMFASFQLHEDFEVAVNSDRDWYDDPVRLCRPAV